MSCTGGSHQKRHEVEAQLRARFEEHRHDLKLFAYGCDAITPEEFVEVYPMLPGQNDLILEITSALRTRSSRAQGDDHAIRGLLQLLGELFRDQKLADQPVGALVTLDQIDEVQHTALDSDVRASMARIRLAVRARRGRTAGARREGRRAAGAHPGHEADRREARRTVPVRPARPRQPGGRRHRCPRQAHRVVRPLAVAVSDSDADAVAPALVELRDPFQLRVRRAEDVANDILDQILSEGERPLVRRVDLDPRNRELATEADVDALLAELRARLLEPIRAGARVRLG